MKQLTAIIFLLTIALCSLAQKNPRNNIKHRSDSTAVKDSISKQHVADSIRDNTPLLTRNQVLDLIAFTIEGYKNAKGQYVKGRFETAINKDDHFNGEEASLVMEYVINIIANDLRRLMSNVESVNREK